MLALAVVLVVPGVVLYQAVRGRRAFGSVAEIATHAALHEASLAAPALRSGLTEQAAARSAGHLRTLLGSAAVALTDTDRLLAWEGSNAEHVDAAHALAAPALHGARTTVERVACADPDCPVRSAVVCPLVLDDRVVGTLTAYDALAGPSLVRATAEVARWVSGQLELAELDESRARLAEAQVRALRAQISPSRTHGEFTTLAEELRSIDRYLLLERARFGDRLQVRLRVAPEALPVAVPAATV